jgi:hypothetical protein
VNFAKDHREEEVDGNDTQDSPVSDQQAGLSIFRESRTLSLLDVDDTPTLLHSALSEDGILEAQLPQNRRLNHIQVSRANFPFLSSIQLLRQQNGNAESSLSDIDSNLPPPIQLSRTWPQASELRTENNIETLSSLRQSQAHLSLNLKSNHKEDQFLWTQSGPTSHWADEKQIAEISAQAEHIRQLGKQQQEEKDMADGSKGPLHLTSGFRVVSHALHENIIATFGRFVSKEGEKKVSDDGDGAVGASSNVIASDDHREQPVVEPVSVLHQKEQMLRLLEESQPTTETGVDRKRLGIGYIAGGVAGGLAGLVLAGPAGGLIGIKAGQLGVLGMLLEGSFTVGALAGGVAAGQNIGKQIDDRIQESRVLALGEGTQRQVLLLIRPSIQQPDPAWDEIYQQAKRTFSGGGNGGLVQRFIPNEASTAKRERYEREVDIVQVEEEELATNDKVLLLVSRILNNKESLPGHVYRQLIQAFRERAEEDERDVHSAADDKELSLSTDTASVNSDSQTILSAPTKRRQDTHAVIKYITAALLETRPGFGSSSSMTEMTATAVESLVFGEVYDLVMTEIEYEKRNSDDDLLLKINDFDHHRRERLCSVKDNGNSNTSIYPTNLVSEKALDALQRLPEAHSAVDKLRYCVLFLEAISDHFSSNGDVTSNMGADFLLPMVCQHILAAKLFNMNAQVAFLEEFARDEQLLRGREGYSLVTLQAALHYLNSSNNFETDIFGQISDNDKVGEEENRIENDLDSHNDGS